MKTKPFLGRSLMLLALRGCGSPPPAQTPQSAHFTISPARAVAESLDPMLTVTGSTFLGGTIRCERSVWRLS